MFICVAGKNNIAVDILKELLELRGGGVQLGIVCNRTETGLDGWQKSLRLFARKNGIQEYNLNEIYDRNDMIFLSLEFDRIIKPEKFNTNRLYNIHFSLLPKYRGMYTSCLPILHGEQETGVTLHKIDEGIDTGEIIAQKKIRIEDTDTARDLYFKYIYYGTLLVKEYLQSILDGDIRSYPQNEAEASYYSKFEIDYSNIKIDLHRSAKDIQNQIRAFSFREYQMPNVYDHKIIASEITKVRSFGECGEILFEDESMLLISSMDYNIILYKDHMHT